MIVVHPTGGLTNKLRVSLSFHEFAIKKGEELHVVWDVTHRCNGFFLDYFHPIEGITFSRNIQEQDAIHYQGYQWHPDFPSFPNNYKNEIYNKLRLLPHVQKQVTARINTYGDGYIAVHIRRTDHVALARKKNCYTTDEIFREFIDSRGSSSLYLATDNRETQESYLNLYADRIKSIELINSHNNELRKTSLESAIVDLYMCANSHEFLGSGYSSFTNTIKVLRALGGLKVEEEL